MAADLNGTRKRRIFVQRQVRSTFIVIILVAAQQSPEMAFAEDDHMVEALTSDRPDEPLCISVLPRRAGCCRPVPNAHGANTLREPSTVDTIPITDHITRCLSPAKSLNQLLRNPFGGRMGGYSQPKQFPTSMLQDQDSIQQPKRNCRHHEQIDRGMPSA